MTPPFGGALHPVCGGVCHFLHAKWAPCRKTPLPDMIRRSPSPVQDAGTAAEPQMVQAGGHYRMDACIPCGRRQGA